MTRRGENADLAERALERHKREDAAAFLPILGVLLLVSPVLNIVAGFPRILGIPAVYLYVFSVWAGLILCTLYLARRLYGTGEPE
ncbi:hypothetical protein HMH01_02615 [Halovulum dunhuangense]|uniref:Uncharacterized protein n=1 Tax=Halovulum dunhuangense TaxID=1505036 RepID=A0A849KUN2_9RHOB|nr:hypothetical protein [Halovulum dunhuangense]NNU79321.1 hypothetical protein [Halovulum dunhuangense]